MKLTIEDIKYMVRESVYNILNENVYADLKKRNSKTKQLGLTYNKGKSTNKNSASNQDYLKTDKMDNANNADTYIVKLKGGINSYNITGIKGMNVMHFFKKFWDNEKAIMKLKDKSENTIENYELTMLEDEREEFLNQFVRKIEVVLTDFISKNVEDKESLVGISLFPVKSSSNFNNKMAYEMSDMSVLGLPIQIINENLLVKDLRNLEKDDEFISRNQDFYDGKYSAIDKFDMGTVGQNLDKEVNKYNTLSRVWSLLPEINEYYKLIIRFYYTYNTKGLSDKMKENLVEVYKKYYDTLQKCYGLKYLDTVSGTEKKLHKEKIIVSKKYTKGPSVEKRSFNIWSLVKPYLRGQKCPITNEAYTEIDICEWEKKSFEIKYLSNPVRLGLRNIYNPNTDEEYVKSELERIKNTLFVIFDDNISGGATLGDICYQCEKLGIKNLVPITFGKMEESNTIGIIPLSVPENGYNYE
jgi:hypothetical protein